MQSQFQNRLSLLYFLFLLRSCTLTIGPNLILGFSHGFSKETHGGLISNTDNQERKRIDQTIRRQGVNNTQTLSTIFSTPNNEYAEIECPIKDLNVIENTRNSTQARCNLTFHVERPMALSFEIDLPNIALLEPAFWIYLLPASENISMPLNLSIMPKNLGISYLKIWLREAKDQMVTGLPQTTYKEWNRKKPDLTQSYVNTLASSYDMNVSKAVMGFPIKVLRFRGILEIVFRVIVATMVTLLTFAMGCDLDAHLIWKHFKQPIGPIIGFVCQFGIMPLLAFGIATTLPIKAEFGFGLLTTGCCPGGGFSNIWTILLHGDLNLSMTMTFLSNVAALGMMPLMLFLYGRFFLDVSKIQIPYAEIAGQLLYVVVPVVAGMLVKSFYPKIAESIRRSIKPLSLLFIVIILGFGTFVNLPIYSLMGKYLLLLPTAAALPWLGFLLAGFFAFLLRRPKAEILTIAIETGIQNIGIAILVLIYSMPQPEGDIGAIMPLVVSIFTPLPLLVVLILMYVREGKCRKRCKCCQPNKGPDHKQLSQKYAAAAADDDDVVDDRPEEDEDISLAAWS